MRIKMNCRTRSLRRGTAVGIRVPSVAVCYGQRSQRPLTWRTIPAAMKTWINDRAGDERNSWHCGPIRLLPERRCGRGICAVAARGREGVFPPRDAQPPLISLRKVGGASSVAAWARRGAGSMSSVEETVDIEEEDEPQDLPRWLRMVGAISDAAVRLFPGIIIITCTFAVLRPAALTWVSTQLITAGLMITMLGMGCTLQPEDFLRIARQPLRLAAGFSLQFSIMPLLAFLLAKAAMAGPASLGFAAPYALGLILVGCSPGGTASNVVTFLAGADVPLSVSLTTLSTLASIVMTPMLVKVLGGALVPINPWDLLLSTAKVVVAPVLVGLLINARYPRLVRSIAPVLPLAATLAVALTMGAVLARQAHLVLVSGPAVVACALGLHGCGFLLGYVLSRAAQFPEPVCRTNSIEVGMQNTSLAAVLALSHFSNGSVIAVPAAICGCVHNILGSSLGIFWRLNPPPLGDPARLAAARNRDLDDWSLDGKSFLAKVVSMYDADTCRIVFQLDGNLVKFNCRLMGIDTPEMKPPRDKPNRDEEICLAIAARNRLLSLCTGNSVEGDVKLTKKEVEGLLSESSRLVWVDALGFDKYGRLLVHLYQPARTLRGKANGATSFNELLVEEGYAKSYLGGTKDAW